MNGHNLHLYRLDELEQRVVVLLKKRRLRELKSLAKALNREEITGLFERLDSQDRLLLFRLLPVRVAHEVFTDLDFRSQNRLLNTFSDCETEELISSLKPDERTALFEDLPATVTRKLLNKLQPEELKQARRLLGYPEESVGRLMTPEFITCRPGWTVERAREHLRLLGEDTETIKTIYITDDFNLLGKISIKELMAAESSRRLEEIMRRELTVLSPYDDREKAVHLSRQRSDYTLPVVNSSGNLLGIVTLDDLLDVDRVETTEDFHRLGAAQPLDDSYWEVGLLSLAYKRIGWLLLLFVGGTLTSSVLGHFEEQLEAVIVLAFFIPLLIDTGGNAGSQSISTIIRAISIGEIHWSDGPIIILKETATGFLMGGLMGLAGFIFAFLIWGTGVQVALVIALSLMAICTWSNLIAGFIPLLASRLGLDPTLMSVPLITTFVDATGLIIYFSLATWLLGI